MNYQKTLIILFIISMNCVGCASPNSLLRAFSPPTEKMMDLTLEKVASYVDSKAYKKALDLLNENLQTWKKAAPEQTVKLQTSIAAIHYLQGDDRSFRTACAPLEDINEEFDSLPVETQNILAIYYLREGFSLADIEDIIRFDFTVLAGLRRLFGTVYN